MARDEKWGLSQLPSTCSDKIPKADTLEIDFNEVYQTIIAEAVLNVNEKQSEVNIKCLRGQDITESGSIPQQLMKQICEADLTITDITSNNPNVLFEYGIRLSVKKSGNIVIYHELAQECIPFDIAALRAISYSTGLKGSSEAKKKIANFLLSYLEKLEPNPYYDYVELYTGRLLEKRMVPLARDAPPLISELAGVVFASEETARKYRQPVFDYMTQYQTALSVDPTDQKEVIENLQLVSQIKGLDRGRLRETLYRIAKICSEDPQRKEEGSRYLEEAKKLED